MIAAHKFRRILWHLIFYGEHSNRYIAMLMKCSHPAVSNIRKKLQALGLSWDALEEASDSELKKLFYPKLKFQCRNKMSPDFDDIVKQKMLPRKKQKSLAILYIEYRIKYGVMAYKKTAYYRLIREYLKRNNACMKQFYRPGEILFIDYLGSKARYQKNGKTIYLPVFVACLGHSKKLFTIATKDMTSHSWIYALTKAFEYYKGVPEVIQFDNAKAMVTKANRIATLNDNVYELSQHYGCICDTSRVGTPTDNSNAENGAKIVTARIIAPMNQDLTFFSLNEVNAYLLSQIDALNKQPLQKAPFSREELFIEKEQQCLRPLPPMPFTPFVDTKSVMVPSTYHVEYKHHDYSVPYTLVGQQVFIKATMQELTVVHDNKEVARHRLSDNVGGFTRLTNHMKPTHVAEENKNLSVFLAWAKDIGRDAERLIKKQYNNTKNPSSRAVGKRCIALQKIHQKVGSTEFLKACRYVLRHDAQDFFDPTDFDLIIRAKAYKQEKTTVPILHANVRGSQYFEGGVHEH